MHRSIRHLPPSQRELAEELGARAVIADDDDTEELPSARAGMVVELSRQERDTIIVENMRPKRRNQILRGRQVSLDTEDVPR